jgi:hypothetical protein
MSGDTRQIRRNERAEKWSAIKVFLDGKFSFPGSEKDEM